jgi:hypothetical protein
MDIWVSRLGMHPELLADTEFQTVKAHVSAVVLAAAGQIQKIQQ